MTTGSEEYRTPRRRAAIRSGVAGRREAVIDAVKAAFVTGRLTDEEFSARIGQALASRTRADLAAITADIPVGPFAAPPARTPDRMVAWATATIIAAAGLGGAVLVGGPP